MNGQRSGADGQPDGSVPEIARDETTTPTPVSSPAGTTAPMVEGGGAPAREPAGPAEGWGAPAARQGNGSAAQAWTVKRGLAVAGAAAVLAAGAGVGVYALTSSRSSSAAAGTTGASGRGLVGPGNQGSVQGGPGTQGEFGDVAAPGQGGAGSIPPDGMAGVSGLSEAVHSEYVVLQGSEYVTRAEQLGTVTEVSSGALTVKSSDGFSRSYALAADVLVTNQQLRRQQAGNAGSQLTAADIVAGGTVRIAATKNGSDYTAESVIVTATTAGSTTGGTTRGVTAGAGRVS
ncbi:hypothetical protein QFZ65_003562 [Arthrobacter sp. B3I9]|uniref:hypothetical protein n=1 Tax=Arthrobacter sp. B3I9 TaxID=3042270 RepID=UPI00278E3A5D|nr:hypothetical protein [Arthrobacter sp. B3I9]MDQ0851624.1 hypothetical protein [Arthrobacter sp. B3I9]